MSRYIPGGKLWMLKKSKATKEKKERADAKGIEVLLSKERTLLSYERTMIALAQLALGLAALGFIIIRFFAEDPGYDWFIAVGIGLVAISGWLFYHAQKDYMHFKKKLANIREKRGHLDVLYLKELGIEENAESARDDE